MSDLEWYPAELVDESCPPHKSSPIEFVFHDGEHWMLGYAPGDAGVMDEDREVCNRVIQPGVIVEFMTAERLGEVDATLKRDGSFELHGTIPRSHNVVIVNGDSDLLYDDFDALIKAIISPDTWSRPSDYIFEEGVESARVTLSFANWSDMLPLLFEIVDGKPVFNPVPAQKQ